MLNEEVAKVIGENVRRYRKEKGYTQERLAEEANIDRTAISKLEKGKFLPTISFILAIMIIITFPFTAYADNESGNGTGDAGSSGTHIIAEAKYESPFLLSSLLFRTAPFPSPLLEKGVGIPLIVTKLDGAWLPNFDFS